MKKECVVTIKKKKKCARVWLRDWSDVIGWWRVKRQGEKYHVANVSIWCP